ncbi:photosystem I P700 chlorophyll A apoprotein A2, chloroplastic, partial [Tanacetum coccineum]
FIMTGAFAHGAIFFIRDYNPEQNEDNVLARMLEHKEAIISHLSWASLFLGFHTLGLYVHNDVMLAFGTPEKQILIEPIFAQWIQSAHGKTSYGFDILLSSTNGPAFNAGRSIWLPGWLNAINENSNSLFLTIGPGDFLVHHAIALGLHTTTLILVKGALDARGSKLMPDKKDFGSELIETLAWAHERTPLANLIRWREKPVALSIVQARLLGLAHFSVGYILTYAVCLASIFPGLLRAREMELLKQLPLLLELLPKGGNWLLGRAAALGKEGKVFHSIRESWYLSIIVFVAPVAAEPLCCWFDPAGHAHGQVYLGNRDWDPIDPAEATARAWTITDPEGSIFSDLTQLDLLDSEVRVSLSYDESHWFKSNSRRARNPNGNPSSRHTILSRSANSMLAVGERPSWSRALLTYLLWGEFDPDKMSGCRLLEAALSHVD